MNLSLYKLRKQIKRDKSGQGGLVAVVLAGLVGSILVSSATSWYLSMRNGMGNLEDKLEAQTIAQSEWERLSHMSLDELEAKRGELAEKYSAGSDSQYQISVNLGEQGTFNNGTCGDIGSDGYANCFKNTTITVYRDGNRMFTTRTLPLMAGNYTRKEIDDKFASLLRLEPIDEKAKIPEGKALYAYLDGQKLPVASAGKNEIVEEWHSSDGLGYYRKYANGWVEQGGCIPQSPSIGEYQTRVDLYIPFKDSNYLLLTQNQLPGYNYKTCSFDYIIGNQKQVNYFMIQTCDHFNYYYWKAEGFYK